MLVEPKLYGDLAILIALSRLLLARLLLALLARLLSAAALLPATALLPAALTGLLLLLARTRVVLLLLARVLVRMVGVRHSLLLEGYAITRSLAPQGSTPTHEQSCAAKR